MEELHKKNRTGKEYFYMIIKKYNSIKKIEEMQMQGEKGTVIGEKSMKNEEL